MTNNVKTPIIYRCDKCGGITAYHNYEIRTGDIICKCHIKNKTTDVNYKTVDSTAANYKIVYSTKTNK